MGTACAAIFLSMIDILIVVLDDVAFEMVIGMVEFTDHTFNQRLTFIHFHHYILNIEIHKFKNVEIYKFKNYTLDITFKNSSKYYSLCYSLMIFEFFRH
ncbi:hypothetical protein E2986_00084 [Frieseomelitta varia]|uniref:Uncharacterized protein n=1 Tax=Frieseomelitta varia TaxID=561572 RepID=A0A833S5L4_9HYME|nr:hypothetical protein E2986_00084 [Frieseomelitta varia]